MDHLEPRIVLDWLVPAAMMMIAWYLRKLDGTVSRVAEALTETKTTVAVLQEKASNHDDRLDRLESKHNN